MLVLTDDHRKTCRNGNGMSKPPAFGGTPSAGPLRGRGFDLPFSIE